MMNKKRQFRGASKLCASEISWQKERKALHGRAKANGSTYRHYRYYPLDLSGIFLESCLGSRIAGKAMQRNEASGPNHDKEKPEGL
ncbi:hypothetical protein [Agrobacterium tumefaciens]|uniref:hypothetical protein n=1 Tax=Agrobacterium tumefaciens TaxID=358 RepID=UPI0015771231|nr:hypothetical protein [Agrobacterium tumefaciens]NTZ91368.1 hypothetical protein [Agrobacterium tumefaciens]